MNLTKIEKLIRYLSILKETLKYSEDTGKGSVRQYKSVRIVFPEDFIVVERWEAEAEDLFFQTEFPLDDLNTRIRSARDHLRYLKQQK